jgi:hypothetical protein
MAPGELMALARTLLLELGLSADGSIHFPIHGARPCWF